MVITKWKDDEMCKPCLENYQRTLTKFINYFQGFHIIMSIPSKYDLSNSKKNTHHRVPLSKFGRCKPTTLPKKLHDE